MLAPRSGSDYLRQQLGHSMWHISSGLRGEKGRAHCPWLCCCWAWWEVTLLLWGQSIPPSAEQWHNIAQCPNFTHWPPFPISSEVRETQASRGDSTAPQEAKAVRIRMCRPVHVPKELSMHGARAAFGPASRPATEGQVVLELAHYPPPSHFPGRGG